MPTSAPMPLNSPRSSSASLARRQVAGVGIAEPVLDHAADRAVDELLIGDLVDVSGADLGVRVAQHGKASLGSAHVIVSSTGDGSGVAASDGTTAVPWERIRPGPTGLRTPPTGQAGEGQGRRRG